MADEGSRVSGRGRRTRAPCARRAMRGPQQLQRAGQGRVALVAARTRRNPLTAFLFCKLFSNLLANFAPSQGQRKKRLMPSREQLSTPFLTRHGRLLYEQIFCAGNGKRQHKRNTHPTLPMRHFKRKREISAQTSFVICICFWRLSFDVRRLRVRLRTTIAEQFVQ